jgi:tripartite-type tricarboxylate transporter receptor subunit TctC
MTAGPGCLNRFSEVKRIRQVLTDHGIPGLRNLALFSVAIDTMLQGPELLNLTVKDVALGNGTVRPVIEVARTRRKSPVRCTLSKATAKALVKWIAVSGKKRADYIFPGRGAGRPHPMTIRQMNRLLKSWVTEAGLDPENYGNESLRRTKALHILNSTGNLETVRMLLGHEKIESTARYLHIAKKGTLGSARVAAAPSDGYTLLAGSMGSHVAAPVLTPNLKYDPERDFAPIGFTAQSPAVIVARKDFPADNLRQFMDYLKQNGDRVKEAHGGIGASSHMACLLFNAQAGVKPSLVAYRGTAPALNDLIGGHVDFFCEQVVSVAPQIAAGTIKAYAISSSERLPTLPDVPTAKEAGLDYQMSIWAGIFAPKATPKPIVDKLAAALDKSLDDPGVKAKVADLGGSIPPKSERTPAKFSRFVNAEIARWSPVLTAAGTGTN